MLAGFIVGAKLISGYLTNSIQRTKINNSYSSWGEILFGAQQEIILGPTLFTIFLEDLFLAIDEAEFASYDADNTMKVPGLMKPFCYSKIRLRIFFCGFLITK